MDIVDAKYANRLNIFVNPFNITKMFNENINNTLIFKLKNGGWEKAQIEPLISLNNKTSVALLSFKDVTESTMISEKHQEEKNVIQGKVDHYAQLFINASCDLYTTIYKIDVQSDSVIRLEFVNGKIQEVDEKAKFTEIYLNMLQHVNPLDRPNIILKTHP